jgi:hypothetical protein
MALRKESLESVIGTLPVCQLQDYDPLMTPEDTEQIIISLENARSTLPNRIEIVARLATEEYLQDRVTNALSRYLLTETEVRDLVIASIKQGVAQTLFDLGASQLAANKITQEIDLDDGYSPTHRLDD